VGDPRRGDIHDVVQAPTRRSDSTKTPATLDDGRPALKFDNVVCFADTERVRE